eukprot:3072738-Pyramimonas_sp.AAC.1
MSSSAKPSLGLDRYGVGLRADGHILVPKYGPGGQEAVAVVLPSGSLRFFKRQRFDGAKLLPFLPVLRDGLLVQRLVLF